MKSNKVYEKSLNDAKLFRYYDIPTFEYSITNLNKARDSILFLICRVRRMNQITNVKQMLITNIKVYSEQKLIPNGAILIKKDKIDRILSNKQEIDEVKTYSMIKIIDGKGLNAIPGFIDGHIHGANGADVMDATSEAIKSIAQTLPREGTTSFLATTTTQQIENINKALTTVAAYKSEPGQADVIGVHLEGPFIERNKVGAHAVEHILTPDIKQFREWQKLSGNLIKTITLAPELDPNNEFIKNLVENDVNVSAGHTEAGINEMKQAIDSGVSQVTHLCNAMTGIQHRDIGVVGATFLYEQLRAEIIADTIHVSPEMIKIIYNNLGSKRLMLITDSMRAKYLKPGIYDVRGREVTVTNDRAMLSNGALAGSVLKMYQGVQNMMEIAGATITDIIEMTAVNPAKQINIFDRKGSIKSGKDADILLVDDQINIFCTFCRGEIAFVKDQGGE
jgi:N-acetylglucosamine-6-phosphate deacetylase